MSYVEIAKDVTSLVFEALDYTFRYPMGIFRTTIGLTGWGALGSALGYTIWTRKSKVFPLDIDDYIFNTTSFARFNPNNNPSMEDICVRRVPLDKIRPELLEEEGSLVEAFCGGIWSGWGTCTLLQCRNEEEAI